MTAVTTPWTTVPTPVATVETVVPRLSWSRATAESIAFVISASPMFSGGPAAQSRTWSTPAITPSAKVPDWEATGTATRATMPAATVRASTVTAEAASAGGQEWLRRKRASGQVSVVISRPITSGHTTGHIWPTSHNPAVTATATSNNWAEVRADVCRAARDLVELSLVDMRPPY
ncbi:hypothetical protein SDIAM26S_05540 [Streptomyces diastaticus subsp. diastaticus]